MRHVVAEEGSQVQARSAQRLGWRMNKRWRALKGRGESLSPLQGSIVFDNPKPGAALRLPLATLFRAFGAPVIFHLPCSFHRALTGLLTPRHIFASCPSV